MANLKEIRNRIKGVKSTQKITKAMKMVATAKLKKIRDNLISLREYTQEIEYLISTTLYELPEEERTVIVSHPLLSQNSMFLSTHLIIFNTSNKGLCGGINNYNIKYLKQRMTSLISRGHKVIIYAIGKKGFDYCASHFPEYLFNKEPIILEEKDGKRTEKIKEEITEMIEKKHVSSSSIIYTQFVSTATQVTKEIPLTPIHSLKQAKSEADYEFDVPRLELLQDLIPEFMLCKILSTIFENSTSEQSARMIAMENATSNAGRAVKSLNLVYNRVRQANITREISEIVAGAESCKQG
jgi:F-type H+-transporting ATPase subunit gamma